MTDKQIAAHMGVRLATVRTFWNRIREKLHANNRGQAIAITLGEALENSATGFDEPELGDYLANTTLGIAIVRLNDQHVVEANDAFLEILGNTRMALKLGSMSLSQFVPLEHQSLMRHAFHEMDLITLATPFWSEFLTVSGNRVGVRCGGAMLDHGHKDGLCIFTVVQSPIPS
jgi:PAS domain-containing protein